jgi:hypothetical protein
LDDAWFGAHIKMVRPTPDGRMTVDGLDSRLT